MDSIVEAHFHRPVLVVHAERFVVGCVFGNVLDPEATIVDVILNLVRVHITAPALRPVGTFAETSQGANTRTAHVVSDVVGVILILLAAVFVHETGQAKARAQITKHRLEAAHITIGFNHRPADRVSNPVCFTDGAI